jgi:lysozyme family protein
MPTPTLSALRDEFDALLKTSVIRPNRLAAVQEICDKILNNQARYEIWKATSTLERTSTTAIR